MKQRDVLFFCLSLFLKRRLVNTYRVHARVPCGAQFQKEGECATPTRSDTNFERVPADQICQEDTKSCDGA